MTPSSDNFGDFSSVQPFAKLHQADDLSDLSHELHQAKRLLKRMTDDNRPTALVDFLWHLEQFKAEFPGAVQIRGYCYRPVSQQCIM